MRIFKFISSLTPIGFAVTGFATLAIIVALFLAVRSLFIGDANVRADLGNEQAGAAIESGSDAVETVGGNEGAADETRDKVTGVQEDVDQASDAAGADAAGRNGLCEQFNIGCEE